MENQDFYSRHLPHYQPPGATIFTTFRLAGSLPKLIIDQLMEEARFQKSKINSIPDRNLQKHAAQLAYKNIFAKWDNNLDSIKKGPFWLAQSEIAELVSTEIKSNDGQLYTLEAFCIMPNHVHLVYTPLGDEYGYYPISRVMRTIKGRTARQANFILGRQGQFWQHESYDHVVRDASELERIINYVLDNPIRAGLPARWVYQRIIT